MSTLACLLASSVRPTLASVRIMAEASSSYNRAVPVGFALRDFRQSDFEELWRMDQVCYEPALAYSRAELAWYMSRPRAFTLVAEGEGGRIAGFLIGSHNGRGLAHIVTIDVLPELQRSGVGSQLMREAQRRFEQAGCDRIRLEVAVDNRAALAFYRRFGYTVVRTIPRYYSNGLDALVLEKMLQEKRAAGPI